MTAFMRLPLITASLLLAACNTSPSTNEQASAENAAQASNAGEDGNLAVANLAQANIAGGNSVAFKEGDSEFRMSWPKVAAHIAPLNILLRATGEELRKEMEAGMRAEQAASQEGGYPFRGYTFVEDWAVVADLPALMVLRSEGYTYTGGAHGMPIVKTLYWDKAANKKLQLADLIDPARMADAVRQRFCASLDAQRLQKRGEPANPQEKSSIPEFEQCIDPVKQIIVPVSKRGNRLDMIHFVVMPYEAGPYSEGIYDIELPIDAAMLGTVKPAWKSVFTAN